VLPLAEAPPRGAVIEPPYQAFVLTSLGLAVAAGFVLATVLPLSTVVGWDWPARMRHLALVQAHGQVQVLGWIGLFILGMAYRLMPRFSGVPLRFPVAVWVSGLVLAASLLLRLAALPAGDGFWWDTGLLASGALGVVSGAAFALVVGSTLLRRESRAGATGYFFLAGSGAFLAQAVLGFALIVLMVQRGEGVLRPAESAGLLHLQLYGFIAAFVLGVSTRAVPTFSGVPRPERSAKALALALAFAVGVYVVAALLAAFASPSEALSRLQGAALASLGPVFLAGVWLVGIFRPVANRLRPASQPQIWFVRSAFFWLAVAGVLAAYYGATAAAEARPVDSDGSDAVRHAVGLGVASIMVVGMAILVLPEFAMRRLQRRPEGPLPALILVLLNAAAALRVGVAVAASHWLEPERYWPMAVAGGLAWAGVLVFGVLFLRNLVTKGGVLASLAAARPDALSGVAHAAGGRPSI
jgi:hypothetical protein